MSELSLVESGRELFASAVSVFPSLDPEKLIAEQKYEFEQCFAYLTEPKQAPLPRRETVQSASTFFLVDGVLYIFARSLTQA